jgi:hypothetical protein
MKLSYLMQKSSLGGQFNFTNEVFNLVLTHTFPQLLNIGRMGFLNL